MKLSCGRFAPSPTGPLHFGSLVAALASYLIAKTAGARWLLRIEDLDPPREQSGAAASFPVILQTLALHWDGGIDYQSRRLPRYQVALEQLIAADLVYACDCNRKRIRALGGLYDGHCRDRNLPLEGNVALRLRHGTAATDFVDGIQGHCGFDEALHDEDFVIRRKDGLFAYQLAVVVDDIEQGIDHVVRGCDLLDSTPRQLRLYDVLGAPRPTFFHIPMAVWPDGDKWSKQTHAPALDPAQAGEELVKGLGFLGQNPPPALQQAPTTEIMQWARENFSVRGIPARQKIVWTG